MSVLAAHLVGAILVAIFLWLCWPVFARWHRHASQRRRHFRDELDDFDY